MTWDRYLESFHAGRPGITEAVLRRSLHAGGGVVTDPYRWLAEAVPARGRVLDLGCGSGPLRPEVAGREYAGLDTSDAELAAARAAEAGPLLRASAAAIPLRGASVNVVACSMSLMVFSPLPQVLAEIARVLPPGGMLVAIVPAGGPLRSRDIPVAVGLLAALGRSPGYPAGSELRRLPAHLAQAGLRLVRDERRRFGYRLSGRAGAAEFLSSLYLPGLPAALPAGRSLPAAARPGRRRTARPVAQDHRREARLTCIAIGPAEVLRPERRRAVTHPGGPGGAAAVAAENWAAACWMARDHVG